MARAPAAAEIEIYPEADRLDDFPHPRETSQLFGQDAAQSVMAAALTGGRAHHAWLLSGRSGIGKATLAYRVARAALARADERELFSEGLDVSAGSATDRQVRALSHPALFVVRRIYDPKTKRLTQGIPVEELRRLKAFLSLTVGDEGRRIVIVDSADDLNASAANALLKALEEPPARTMFLIMTAAPGRLLPTIRSRCRTLAMLDLGEADLKAAATVALNAASKPLPSEAEWRTLTTLAEGSVGRALSLFSGGGLAIQKRIDGVLNALPKLDTRAVHQLADDLQSSQQDASFQLFFDLLQAALARLATAEATNQGAASDVALAQRLIGRDRLASFAELWETLARDKADLTALKLDRRSLILQSFARIEAASRG